MESRTYLLADAEGHVFGRIEVHETSDGWLLGKLTEDRLTPAMKQAFAWLEEIANDQMLSFLNEAEDAIEKYQFGIVIPGGNGFQPVYNLQIMNKTDVAFRLSPRRQPNSTLT
jgi:hypothetical protein